MHLIQRYNARAELAAQFPSWFITTADLGGIATEVVCWRDKLIIVDPAEWCGDQEMAYAHVLVHLQEHMDHLETLTDTDEWQASLTASIRLDRRQHATIEPDLN